MGYCYEEIRLIEAEIQKEASIQRASLPTISTMVVPGGFEPPISWMRTRYPGPLDDGTT